MNVPNFFDWKKYTQSYDDRRDLIVLNNGKEAILFCTKQFIQIAKKSIADHHSFTVALSGGTTPNAIFTELSKEIYQYELDWNKVFLFWSDERSVPPNHPESNYHMAMQAGLSKLPIPKEHVFRMNAENDIEKNALQYEKNILSIIPSGQFDLVMLGMGEDGHTASLFPFTKGLETKDHLVIANYVPQKETWRMSLTYNCIQSAKHIFIYVMGKNKAEMVAKALKGPFTPNSIPIQQIGTDNSKAVWILDKDASEAI